MAPVARELSKIRGVLEPLQNKDSIGTLTEELYAILNEHAHLPVILVGHSWGGFFSIIFADKFPQLVNKLILIGTGPFEDRYVPLIKETRRGRLTREEKAEFQNLEDKLRGNPQKNGKLLEQLGNLTSRVDSYDPIPSNSEVLEYDPDIHMKVWNEAVEMRKEGKFIEMIKNINCPVIAVHGDYDPHPYKAVKELFTKYVKSFKFVLLEKCGHYPWLERKAKDEFYRILNDALT
jgi:pimeloyl-ACP methyl ester carboxylesterase